VRGLVVKVVAASGIALVVAASSAQRSGPASAERRSVLAGSPIKHVVVIYQENHSFNDLLGKLCVQEHGRCLGTTVGKISDGSAMDLIPEPDLPPAVEHNQGSMVRAINGGAMNGWDRLFGCQVEYHYQCMTQAYRRSVPNLWSLANKYTISDMTFETGMRGSWGSHLQLVASTIDGFVGNEPTGPPGEHGDGCDTHQVVAWNGGDGDVYVPSCVPNKKGRGPFQASPVKYVPTIMTRMDAAGLPWHIYAPGRNAFGYGWAICPTFYECLGGPQAHRVRGPYDFAGDAAEGKLSALSIVIPYYRDSQHNGRSLIQGDDWIAQNVAAVMNGPDWDSTAIFITYDDCGCFYDPVLPPDGAGIRVPMVIVSPYARARFVDHTTALGASMLAFTEHLFGLQPLSTEDANAYDYANAFNFQQTPLGPIPLPQHTVPWSSVVYMAHHPPDPEDPT
jgi:phospholipase C